MKKTPTSMKPELVKLTQIKSVQRYSCVTVELLLELKIETPKNFTSTFVRG